MLKNTRWIITAIFVTALAFGAMGSVQADAPTPQINETLPHPPTSALPSHVLTFTPTANYTPLTLPKLKAVLLVGPIDGDNGEWTLAEIANMELAARVLENNGVEVYRFYTPNNDWNAIKAAANGAQFLFYRGHGVYWPDLRQVGGFSLASGFYSSNDIRQSLKLAPGAIVMVYGCYTAGSSSGESSIDLSLAQERVTQYASPFIDLGAAGYYADWFGDAFAAYVDALFQGMTLGQAYEIFYDFNAATVDRSTFPGHTDLAMWLDKDNWNGWQYNDAFVGQADATLESLFQPQPVDMVLTPPDIHQTGQPDDSPYHYQVEVQSSAPTSFNWQASLSGSQAQSGWVSLDKTSGKSGETVNLTLDPDLELGTYTTTMKVWTSDPNVNQPEQLVTITLNVVENAYPNHIYLPVTRR